MQAQNTAAGTTGLAERHATCSVDVCHARQATPGKPRTPRAEGDGVETIWRRRGDPMKIVALRAVISPASGAGHVILSLVLTAWDIRGTQRGRRSSIRASPQVTQQRTT